MHNRFLDEQMYKDWTPNQSPLSEQFISSSLENVPESNFCFDEDEGHDILKVRCCLGLVLVNKFHILLDQ